MLNTHPCTEFAHLPGRLHAPARHVVADSAHFRLKVLSPDHPQREGLQGFISEHFCLHYGARVSHFGQNLLGCRNSQGQWSAALGFTDAAARPLFLEQYLDMPIEQAIAMHTGHVVPRSQIVEVGNLAARHAGSARLLIAHATRHLHEQGYRWVCFTATASLLNSFVRLNLHPTVVAQADPSKLADGGQNWGRYYDTQPQVMIGHIASGHARLER